MKVAVQDESEKTIWVFGMKGDQMSGTSCTKYRDDGTLKQIIVVLEAALSQAKGELSLSSNKGD